MKAEQKRTIVFVDDEPNFLNGLKRLLRPQRHEWEMFFATSADEAFEYAMQHDPDALISDVNMPEKTGFDLLMMLQAEEKTCNIPIIILTGNAERHLKSQALEFGAADLLNKPVVFEDLIARIRNVLQIRDYERDLRNQNEILEEKVKERTKALERSRLDIIMRLAKAGEFRDEDTGHHIMRVAGYCRVLANALQLENSFVERLTLTSPLHDIGKIGIPDNILLKPGKLDDAEWDIMRKHTSMGKDILLERPTGFDQFQNLFAGFINQFDEEEANDIINMASSIAENHHEKYDGGGYPNRKSGEDIPIEARIVAIADVYDALRSDRPYKKAFSKEKTESIIEEGKGKHFDPEVFGAFQSCCQSFDEIHERLNDNV